MPLSGEGLKMSVAALVLPNDAECILRCEKFSLLSSESTNATTTNVKIKNSLKNRRILAVFVPKM